MTAMQRGGGAGRVGGLRDALLRGVRRPFASLPSRIITSVFGVALVTSFAMAYTATQSTEDFLRLKIDERIPQTLVRVAERLDRWYAQRNLDIATFAQSNTVADSVDPGTQRDRVAQEEARSYLAYVREGFTQYAALFVLDEAGRVRVWAGERPDLAESLPQRLAKMRRAGTGTFLREGGEHYQLISSPIVRGDIAIGSLYAMIGAGVIDGLLQSDDPESNTRIFLVGEDGEIVAHSQGLEGRFHKRPISQNSLAGLVVEDYASDQGEHVVGSAMRLSHFGWGLVVEESYDAAFAPIVSVRRRITAINLGIVIGFGVLAFLIARSIVQRTHRVNEDLANANEELRRGNEVLEQLSFTDGLTRLHNHRYFQDRLRVEAKRADRSNEPLALLLVDIDDFKALNDRYGHAVGDEVLRCVATALNASVRETDLPTRYGGEEFAVLAPDTSEEGALVLAEKLRAAIADSRIEAEGLEQATDLRVTVSIGVAVYDGEKKRFFNNADRALYRAKANGKDCALSAHAS